MTAVTKEDLDKGLKFVGIVLMAAAIIGVIESIIGFANPGNLPATTANGATVDPTTVAAIGLGICVVINVVEFYFGYLGYKGKITKTAATICLIAGVLLAIEAGATVYSSGFSAGVLMSFLVGVAAIAYHDFYRKLVKMDQN